MSCLLFGIAAASSAWAFEVQQTESANKPLLRQAFVAPELDVKPSLDATENLAAPGKSASRPAVAGFAARNPGSWEMRWDRRSDRPNLVQGSGVPLVPGSGNQLDMGKLGLKASEKIDLAVVEARLLDFIGDNHDFLKVDGLEFGLDPNSSTGYGEGNTHWFVEMAQSKNGVPVRGAHLFFRISHGNIVQFGSELMAPVKVDTIPVSTREAAFELAYREMGMPASTRGLTMKEPGELMLLPYAADGANSGENFRGIDGSGYAHRLAWRFVFTYAGDDTTYEVLVDAKTNRVIEVQNLNLYATATVDGGVFLGSNTGPETIVPMPFVAVTNGSAKVTDALGIYNYGSGSANTKLNGKYFTMSDKCGSISLTASSGGNLHLGTDTGTDCGSTTSAGGAGNTRASRNGFYYLTRINRKAASFLPTNSWIASNVTANMNVNDVCNAFWDGSTANFFKSGTSTSNSAIRCANTGEIAAVFLHEWGHGMDQNAGGTAGADRGTGEAVGDTFAFLETKSACIGTGFYASGQSCTNCASTCTGVRDLNAFSTLGPRTVVKPSTITADNGTNCDRYACPYNSGAFPYQGPMGYEGHCESYIASSANWDLAQKLVTQYGATGGYQQMDKIWYGSLMSAKSAYRVASGGKCNTAAVVDGCASSNWYTVYLAADDNDGNLANGTPNACRIWDAFNAHGIACGARPRCTVGGGNAPPVATIRYTTLALTANFTDASTDVDGTIASREWNFGDGTTSTEANPVHTYLVAGTYTVTLTVTDNENATNSATSRVTVPAPPNAAPTANFTYSVSNMTASFTDASSDSDGTIVSRAWNFGDGGTATTTSPSHAYAATGTYTVRLTVTDDDGATATTTKSVSIVNPVQTYRNDNDYVANTNGGRAESPITVSGRVGNAPSSTPVMVYISHARIFYSKIDLIAPDGTVYPISNAGGDSLGYYQTVNINLSSEAMNGTWKLRLTNNHDTYKGTINAWSIRF
jgi:PKD repeat protein